MAKALQIEIKGIPKVNKYLNKKNKNIINDTSDAITQATFFMEGEIKASIGGERAEPRSVDTGTFRRNTIGSKKSKLVGVVSNKTPYAEKLEFSPDIKGGPRRHFSNSLARNKAKIKEFIQKAVKRATS